MKLNKLIYTLLLFFTVSFLYGQEYPQDYGFPLEPGHKHFLSGNMGELRSTHFHAGIDIKTGGVEGKPVHATQDGYISRIKISTVGYGNALYMLHPDGHTSVYGHLSKFAPAIDQWVTEQQYDQKTFLIELFPEKGQFSFKKGDIIGWSGNSGGSEGPHLHFEIRDAYQHALNPLLFEFPEIKDHIPPVISAFALAPANIQSRVAGRYHREVLTPRRVGHNYTYDTITVSGTLHLELLAHDILDGSANRDGIYIIRTLVNGKKAFEERIDTINFYKQSQIHIAYNYAEKMSTGRRFYNLYEKDGNTLSYYETSPGNGNITVAPGEVKHIRIQCIDSYKNESHLDFTLKGEAAPQKLSENIPMELDGVYSQQIGNVLKIYAPKKGLKDDTALFYVHHVIMSMAPSYTFDDAVVYLWDLRKGLPDSVLVGNGGQSFNFLAPVYPGENKRVATQNMHFAFSHNTLFDSLYFSAQTRHEQGLDQLIYDLEPKTQPLRYYMDVTLHPEQPMDTAQHIFAYSLDDEGNFDWEGGQWKNGSLTFSTRALGNFVLLPDTVGPTIEPAKINKNEIQIHIDDERSGIDHYEAYLNGKWLLMKWEPKKTLIWSRPLQEGEKLEGDFKLIVLDKAGNKTIFATKIQ